MSIIRSTGTYYKHNLASNSLCQSYGFGRVHDRELPCLKSGNINGF